MIFQRLQQTCRYRPQLRTILSGILFSACLVGSAAAQQSLQNNPKFRPEKPAPEAIGLYKPIDLSRREELPNDLADQLRGKTPVEQVDQMYKWLRRKGYSLKINNTNLNNAADREILKLWAIWRAASLTAQKEPEEIRDQADDLRNELKRAGSTLPAGPGQQKFRQGLFDLLIPELAAVMDNSMAVRLQAALTLGQMDLKRPGTGLPVTPPITYSKAALPLIDVIEDPKQLEPVKVVATRMIDRLFTHAATLPAAEKLAAADALTAELAKPNTYFWYQMVLADALASLDLKYNRDRKPVVHDALVKVVGDNKRYFAVRTEAAKALTRIPLPAEADPQAIARLIHDLMKELVNAYQANPNNPLWKPLIVKMDQVFHAVDEIESDDLPVDSLLASRDAAIATLGKVFEPVFVFVLTDGNNGQRLPQNLVDAVNEDVLGGSGNPVTSQP
ncbi:hypothetical protein [Stratiformator vulcanicus]|uniref:HEAT repeat protein n=1 Tax=Stratiformator vulcanicus TaxID=2527980 RepID=A0A517QWH1_9PLAN|nr:hypothetical protein [Stratiformator vulcanicus]QDT35937.1 hypothetical protein Pan189_02900 [Stratiformator vulcanicus]